MIGRRPFTRAVAVAALLCGGAGFALRGRGGGGGEDGLPAGDGRSPSAPNTLVGSRRVPGRDGASGRRAQWIADAASKDVEVARAALLALHRDLDGESWTLEDLWRLATLADDSLVAERVRHDAEARLLADEHAQALPRHLLAAVRSPEDRERHLAAKLLPQRPVLDESLIPALRAVVVDEAADYGCRKALLHSIERLGARAAVVAPDLVDWMRRVETQREEIQRENPDTHFSWDHVEFDIQRAISATGAAALPVILRALAEPEPAGVFGISVRYELERAIAEMPREAAPELLALTSDAREGVRAAALEALLRHEEMTSASLAAARDALRDSSAKVRETALAGLARRDSINADELVSAFSDPSPQVRSVAGSLLAKRPEEARAVLPRVLEMLRSPEYADQLTAAGLLPKLGEAGLDGIPDLIRMRAHLWDDRFYRDRGPALEALLALGPAAAPRIVEVARGATGDARSAALDALRRLEGVGGAQLAPLAADLDRLKGVERMETAAVLARAGDTRAQTVLLEALSSPEGDVRVAAARGLAESPIVSPAAVDVLAALERDAGARLHAPDSVWPREWPAYYAYHLALLRAGRATPAAMVPLLSDRSGDVCTTAAEALGSAGAEGVAQVAGAWSRLDSGAKRLVLRPLLGGYGKEPAAGARELGLRALEDSDPAVRLQAAEVLGRHPDLEAKVVAARIELLAAQPVEVAREAAARLAAGAERLGPYEERLREVRGITDTVVARRVRDILDVIEAARRAQR